MTSSFAYPVRVLLGDYARAASAFLFLGAILFLPLHWALMLVFGAIAALLLVFGLRTYLRQRSRIVLTETGIQLTGPRPRRIAWSELDGFRLRYFSMRRDRKQGWMELTLRAPGGSLSIESQIDGFEQIVGAAAKAAAGLEIDEASLANLGALGIVRPKPR